MALLTAGAYCRLLNCGFITFDDPSYVTDNTHVINGLTFKDLAWAFRSAHAANWHPLTWISHMADCDLYGLNPVGHHLTSLLLHVASTILLFAVLERASGALWRSSLVAALFAWHPLRVESVAWISERKDVLCGFFWLLATWAYVCYAQQLNVKGATQKSKIKNQKFYFVSLVLFAMALMSKPMAVTLPFVLLLLDFWPLRRKVAADWRKLILEKLPFFALAAASSIVTFWAQKAGGAVGSIEFVGVRQRVINAFVSYVLYLCKWVWPDRLSVIYPLQFFWPAWQVLVSIAVIVLATMLVISLRRSRPYLLVGWFWYLGTLVPVIGLVQVGGQSMADRYTYLPLIGILIMAVWYAADRTNQLPSYCAWSAGVVAALILAGCGARSWWQIGLWRDGATLFQHALAVTESNWQAHLCLGLELEKLGRTNDALAQFNAAIQITANDPSTLYNKGRVLAQDGKFRDAGAFYRAALDLAPDDATLHYNLANILAAQGKLAESVAQYQASLRVEPDAADALSNLGAVLARLGQPAAAADQFQAALRLRPDMPEAQIQLGIALQKLGKLEEARGHFAEAVRLNPDSVNARLKLGMLLAVEGKFGEAKSQLGRVTELDATNDVAWYNLAAVHAAQGHWDDAARDFGKVIALKPNDADAHSRRGIALAQAGQPDAGIIECEHAAELTGHHDPRILLVLAEACAAAGRFGDAIAAAQQAQTVAGAQSELNVEIERRLQAYQSKLSQGK